MEKIANRLDGFAPQGATVEVKNSSVTEELQGSIWENTQDTVKGTFGNNEIIEAVVVIEELKADDVQNDIQNQNKEHDKNAEGADESEKIEKAKKEKEEEKNKGIKIKIPNIFDIIKDFFKPKTEEEKRAILKEKLDQSTTQATDSVNLVIEKCPDLGFDKVDKDNLGPFLDENAEAIISALMCNNRLSNEQKLESVKNIMDFIFKDAQYYQGTYIDDLEEDLSNGLKKENWKFINIYNETLTIAILNKLRDRQACADGIDESANGKIDKNFQQGRIGDCWLLSSIYAIAQHPKGKQVLEDSLEVLKNGDVVVTLQGVGKSYTISYEELNGSEEYSRGDMDVRALELAVERYMEEKGEDIDGDIDSTAFEILLGKKDSNWWHGRNGEKWGNRIHFDKSFYDRVNDPDYICTASTSSKNCSVDAYTTDGELLPNYIVGNHAYSVVGADEDNVYLVNPWDTSKTIRISKQEFEKYFTSLGSFDMGD